MLKLEYFFHNQISFLKEYFLKEYNLKEYQYDIVIARMEPENNIEMILEGYMQSKMERDLVIVGSLKTKFGKYISEKYQNDKIRY